MTDCLEVPTRQYAPAPPMPPTLSDAWAIAAWRWMSDALGVAAADRTQWAGERACIRDKAATGAIR